MATSFLRSTPHPWTSPQSQHSHPSPGVLCPLDFTHPVTSFSLSAVLLSQPTCCPSHVFYSGPVPAPRTEATSAEPSSLSDILSLLIILPGAHAQNSGIFDSLSSLGPQSNQTANLIHSFLSVSHSCPFSISATTPLSYTLINSHRTPATA